jgi:uncharacterized protein YegP (UPF0339 family)
MLVYDRFRVYRENTCTVPCRKGTWGGAAMAGKFELYTDKRGEYRFRLKASNGQPIAVSEGYTTKAAAKNGIESVRKNAPDATLDDQTE